MNLGNKVLGLVAMLAAVALAPAAKASTIYDLTSDHCSDGCAPADTVFGNITLTQDGTAVDVTVHLNSPFEWAKTGAVDDQALLFYGTGVVLTDITIDAHTPALQANLGPFTVGAIPGNFDFGISCPSCGGGLSSTFSNDFTFHVANAVIADLIPASGSAFAADIGNSSTTGQYAQATGPIDASLRTSSVPEPVTSSLVGMGLIGLFLVRRRVRG